MLRKTSSTNVKRIVLVEEDGSETIINVVENLHFLFGFCKTGENEVPLEILVYGNTDVVGEIFYQMGEAQPELVKHCVRRSTMKIAGKIIDEIKKSGVDPIAEALKKVPPPEGGTRWN